MTAIHSNITNEHDTALLSFSHPPVETDTPRRPVTTYTEPSSANTHKTTPRQFPWFKQPEVNYRVYNSPTLDPIPSHTKWSVYAVQIYSFTIHFNIIFPFKSVSYKHLCRSQWPCGLWRRSTAARLLGSWVQIPPGGHRCLSVVSVVCCCPVEVSATSWRLVQRSLTDCGVMLCVI